MKANLTKLINDFISLGLTLADKSTNVEDASRQAKAIAVHCVPEGCDADIDLIEEHLNLLKSRVPSQVEYTPVVTKVTEFHGKFTVRLSNGQVVSFDDRDVIHY